MGRYLKFQENDDNTCTAEVQVVEHEEPVIFLVPMPFDTFLGLITQDQAVMERAREVAEGNVIFIPNSVEG